jgi:hypothetical protein
VKHTPGPWTVRTCKGHGLDQIDAEADGFTIADVEAVSFASVGGYAEHPANPKQRKARPGEPEANARLIAAAPDLLAALQKLINKINWAFDSEIQGVLAEEVDAAEAAIAKAEGRS